MMGGEEYGEAKKTLHHLQHTTLSVMVEAMLWHGHVWLQGEPGH